jgi:hypothetical protein
MSSTMQCYNWKEMRFRIPAVWVPATMCPWSALDQGARKYLERLYDVTPPTPFGSNPGVTTLDLSWYVAQRAIRLPWSLASVPRAVGAARVSPALVATEVATQASERSRWSPQVVENYVDNGSPWQTPDWSISLLRPTTKESRGVHPRREHH